jgi:hypothetical protein
VLLAAFAQENETGEMFVTKKVQKNYCHKIPLFFVPKDERGKGDGH